MNDAAHLVPEPKLENAPLETIGNEAIGLISHICGVENLAIFIAVADIDTGEIVSTANLCAEDLRKFITVLYESKPEAIGEHEETIQ